MFAEHTLYEVNCVENANAQIKNTWHMMTSELRHFESTDIYVVFIQCDVF